MIKHISPELKNQNGVSLYGQYIDRLLPKIKQPQALAYHFEIGYTGSSELWQAYQLTRQQTYVITLHDPPQVIGRPFEPYLPSRNFFVKVIRKLLDRTVGQLIIRQVVRRAAAVIVLNRLAKPSLIKKFRLQASRVFESPLPVLLPLSSVTDQKSDRLQLLYFGNVSKRKGVSDLIAACQKLPANLKDWQLDIVGSFEANEIYRQQLSRQIKSAGLEHQIRLAGFVADDELAQMIASADIIILPYHDSGIVHASGPLVASLAAGKAVIASQIPIFEADIKDGQDGSLFPPGDVDSLANRLQQLIQDDSLRQRLGASAQATIEQTHSDAAIIASLEEAYQQL